MAMLSKNRVSVDYYEFVINVIPLPNGKFAVEITNKNKENWYIERGHTSKPYEYLYQSEAIYNAVRLIEDRFEVKRGSF